MSIQLRECRASDSDMLLLWRNSEPVRSISRQTKRIYESEHSAWFRDRLTRSDLEPFWIVTLLGTPIGYVRFDKNLQIGNGFEISILINEQNQHKGFGRTALNASITEFQKRFSGEKIYAIIREDNFQSIKLFKCVGFEYVALEREFCIYELCTE